MVASAVIKGLGWVLIAVGMVVMIFGAVTGFQQYRFVENSPSVDARVVDSQGLYPPTTQPPAARYELWYQVGEKTFTERFVSPGSVLEVRDRVATHPAGNTFSIRYNPANPQQIYPNLGINSATLGPAAIYLGIGISLALLGGALACFSQRSPERF